MLLAELAFPPEELAFGHTKIFIRSPRTVSPGMGERGHRGDPAMGQLGCQEGQGLTFSEQVPALCPAGSPEPILGAPG